MRLISFNVNGYRAVKEKGFDSFFDNINADIFSVQETKMQEGQADIKKDGYYSYMNSALKKGYSGTLTYTKEHPLKVIYGLPNEVHNLEGRVITLEFEKFFLVNCYVPNSQPELKRLDYRMTFEDEMRNYLKGLDKIKPVIYCGDLNVAHEEIDLKNPKDNLRNPGFSIEERTKLDLLLEEGFTDSFRALHKDLVKYSWWSYRFNARLKGIGWRIDYFIISNRLLPLVKKAEILDDVFGSDHCPILLEIDL